MAATGPAAALAYEHGSSCSSMFAAALKRVNLPVAGVLLMFCFLYYVAVACVVRAQQQRDNAFCSSCSRLLSVAANKD